LFSLVKIQNGIIVNQFKDIFTATGRLKTKNAPAKAGAFFKNFGTPTGIRTPVAAVKGQCPRPLDDGRVTEARTIQKAFSSVNAFTAFLKMLPISVCYFPCIMPVLIKRKTRHVV
jgi:hypothetical protein